MNEKALIIGGSGFLGSHVADALSESGYDVTIFDIVPSPFRKKEQGMIVGDIQNRDEVRNAVSGFQYVYHFAGIADIEEAQKDPIAAVRCNVLATTYILEACREHKIKRMIYASSVYVYSDQGSFYRSTKQASELLIENYQEIFGLDFTILRFGSLYGRRANDFNFIHNAIKQALVEGKITREGSGEEVRDYINVLDDLYKNSYIMITGTQTVRVKEVLIMIKEMFNNSIELDFIEGQKEDHYKITPYSFKPRIARKLTLNYHYDIGQGILDTIYDTYKRLSQEGCNMRFDSLFK
jgi:UDP-glucose 4-epimerase